MGDIFKASQISYTAKENFEKKTQERKRNILYLIKSYLQEIGLDKTVEILHKEANLLDSIDVCDNIDLDTIIQEYSSFYFAKFNKHPKICKKQICELTSKKDLPKRSTTPSNLNQKPSKSRPKSGENSNESFEISIKQISNVKLLESNYSEPDINPEDMVSDTEEMKELVNVIKKEMVTKNLGVSWQDCVGLDKVIQLLKEAIVYPQKYPFLFSSQVSSWKGILLFGPPGTGKTLVARALASECKTTFINVSPSTFISKWRGESEKLIKALFEVAKHYSPTTIFIDELDALGSNRDETQHEASKRFKSELLTQMDGLNQNGGKVFVLATTNLPWVVDKAILRRFEKKILVDLPDLKNRMCLFKKYIDVQNNIPVLFDENEILSFASDTGNFSGSDIKTVCKDAFMRVVRRRIKKLEGDFDDSLQENVNVLLFDDVKNAIWNTKALDVDVQKYYDWDKKYGCI